MHGIFGEGQCNGVRVAGGTVAVGRVQRCHHQLHAEKELGSLGTLYFHIFQF